MPKPLMPKATAVWLVENTALTFEQIAEFCGLHMLEIQAIADGEVAIGMQGLDPVTGGELSKEEIERCVNDSTAQLKALEPTIPQVTAKPKGARYTPVSKRQDRPDAIAWLLKNYPEMSDAQISKLIGTTKPTINAVRDKTHWHAPNIKARNPVSLGMCSEDELEKQVAVARARAGTVHGPAPTTPAESAPPPPPPAPPAPKAEPDAESVFGPTPPPEPPQAEPDAETVFGPAPKSGDGETSSES